MTRDRNHYSALCCTCHQPVPTGAGLLYRGDWRQQTTGGPLVRTYYVRCLQCAAVHDELDAAGWRDYPPSVQPTNAELVAMAASMGGY